MIPIPPIRIERVRTKLSLEAYAELCRILARAPRVPFKVGMGRAPSPPWSHGRLAKQFGISQARVSQIAKQVREGTAGCRAFGVRAVQLRKGPGNLTPYVKGVSLPAQKPGQAPIIAHSEGPRMLAVLESGCWRL